MTDLYLSMGFLPITMIIVIMTKFIECLCLALLGIFHNFSYLAFIIWVFILQKVNYLLKVILLENGISRIQPRQSDSSIPQS